ADDRQDDPAFSRRHAGRLEYLHGLLPGGAAGRLCLCPCEHGLAEYTPASAGPWALALFALPGLSDQPGPWMGTPRRRQPHSLAARAVAGVGRVAVLRSVHDCALVAKVVCP